MSCTAQVWRCSVGSSPWAVLLMLDRIGCAKDLNWGAADSV